MRSVYSNSFLNIAATGSDDGGGGCFKKINSLLVRPCQIDAVWTGPYGPLSGAYVCVPASIWNQYIENSPLCKRAWVLQERFLAPRTLHFGATQIFWECRQVQAAEIYPHGFTLCKGALKCLDPLRDGSWLRKKQLGRYRLKDYASNSESQMAHTLLCLYSLWDEVVICYTHVQLTVSSEKLVALSGIAKEVQTMIGDEYNAGLWRRHMLHQLLWGITGRSLPPPAYRAPSWSWASVDGKIFQACLIPRGDGRDLLAKIHKVQIVSTTADTSGQVTHGTIRIVGALYRVSLQFYNRRMPSNKPGNPSDLYYDVTVVFDGWYPNNYFAFCRRDFPRNRELGQDTQCLPLRFVPGIAYGLGGIGRIQGLVLQPTKKKHGQFRRFGNLSIFQSRDALITEVFATLGSRQVHSAHEVEYEGEIQKREAARLEVPNPTITNPNKICVWSGKKYIVSTV
jgi:hypothetical protein